MLKIKQQEIVLLNNNYLFFTKVRNQPTKRFLYAGNKKIREQIATINKVTREATKSKTAAQQFLQASGIKKIAAAGKK